jgi:hypothetical protein
MSNLIGKRLNQLSSVRFVTHKGNSMKITTIAKAGQRALKIPCQSITDHPLTRNVSRTTKFIKSNPVVIFDGEPPF